MNLMDRAKAGDARAFLAVFDSVVDIALAQARRYVPEQIDDCLQEMRLRLWEKLSRFEGGRGAFRAWARIVFRNLAIDLRRRAVTRRLYERRYGLQGREPPRPDVLVIEEEEHEMLTRLIERIPSPTYRHAVRRRCLDGYTDAETAEEMGVQPSSVKVSVHRGVRQMIADARRLNLSESPQLQQGGRS